jgi:Ca2+-binding EF-hand superfamily protein
VRAFQTFDRAGSGFITTAQFRRVLTALGDHRIEPDAADGLVAFVDPEDTGRVDYARAVDRILAEAAVPMPVTDPKKK